MCLKILVVSAALTFAIQSAEAANIQQFDLICSGSVTSFPIGQIGNTEPLGPALPYTTHLRIDLNRKMFCQDDCKLPEGIALIQPDQIVLRHTQELLGYDDFGVSRTDGTFQTSWFQKANAITQEPFQIRQARGTCVKAKYSIVPAGAF